MTIDTLLQQAQAIPSIPKVVLELIQGLDRDDALTGDLAARLAADPMLSAKVLRLANSAYYGMPRQVKSIDDALVLLGFTKVRTLVLSSGLIGSFQGVSYLDLKQFWRYSLHTAVVARYLAPWCEQNPDLAFTIGLLHGLGRLVMQGGLPDEMRELDAQLGSSLPDALRLHAEQQAVGYDFSEVGAALAHLWKFPSVFADTIRHCAEPLRSPPVSPLVAAIHLAMWRAQQAEQKAEVNGVHAKTDFPQAVALAVGRPELAERMIHDMPDLSTLSAGMEALIEAG